MENTSVDVIDNFFDKDLHQTIFQSLNKPRWGLTGGNVNSPFWHIDDLEREEFYSVYLKNLILKKINLLDVDCVRIYANGQTAGQVGTPHIDDGHYTFLYFPNLDWNIRWQGHLMFINKLGLEYEEENGKFTDRWYNWVYNYDEREDEIEKIVTYKPNRAVIFQSNIVHYADAPHRLYNGLRISLAYKFKRHEN